jgi:hypothetical protein
MTPFRLRPGDLIQFDGQPCRVLRVNDCSALVEVPRPPRQFTTRFGVTVHLQPSPALVRISPYSETPILNR